MMNTDEYLFISFSSTQWNGPWLIRQKLMSEFAKMTKVIYVTPREELRNILEHVLKPRKWKLGIRKVNKNLILIESPWLFPKIYKFKIIDKIIDQLYHLFIKVVAFLFDRKRTKILYIWEPWFSSFLVHYKRYRYIYHPYDMFEKYVHSSDTPETLGAQIKIEKELVRHALLFYTVSESLRNYYYKSFSRRPKILPNAVDDIYFEDEIDKALQEEADNILSTFSGKKIGYCGSVKGILDLDIIIDSAHSLKNYSFLFIGPIIKLNNKYDEKVERLFSLNNVHYLGSFSVNILPYLLRSMDILIMVYSNNKDVWTYYGHPAKLFEYMATGKPIISTPHPSVYKYRKYITVVKDTDGFISAVKRVKKIYTPSLCKEMVDIARENTWRKRVEIILKDVQDSLQELQK